MSWSVNKYPCVGVPEKCLKAVQQIISIDYALCGYKESRMIVSTEGKLLKTVFGSPETIELLTHTACMEVIDANDLDIEDLRTLESPPEVLEQLREMLWKNVDPSLEPDT